MHPHAPTAHTPMIEDLNGKIGCKLTNHGHFTKSSDNSKASCGRREVCDGLVHCHQSSLDVSIIVAQLSEHNDVSNNQLREVGVDGACKVLVRDASKECTPSSEKNKTVVEAEYYENDTATSEERAIDSNEEVDGDGAAGEYEKLNEWSKPARGGKRVGRAKGKTKTSNGMASNRHELFEGKYEVDEDKDKSVSGVSSEEETSATGKKTRSDLKEKKGSSEWARLKLLKKKNVRVKQVKLITKRS